jgi:hypothetical protein
MDDPEFGLSRDDYNRFVQQVQADALAFGMEHRIEPEHFDDGRIDGTLKAYWDGWQTLGRETHAMTPEADRTIYPERWERIKAEAANALAKS